MASSSLEGHAWVLGRKYTLTGDAGSDAGDDAKLHRDLKTIPWFTYRRGFPSIGDSTYVSDAGWGCMLRCGQMVLASTLCRFESARIAHTSSPDEAFIERQVLRQFADTPVAKYSIHRIALEGKIMDKDVGAWFGPNCMAQVIRSLTQQDCPLKVHVVMDSCLSTDEVEGLCGTGSSWSPLLLLVPLRLGMSRVNAEYTNELKRVFGYPESVGAIGGRPNAAFYFVGTHGDELIYLDPHHLQPSTGDIDDYTNLASYSSPDAQRMAISSTDPSLSLAFFCHTQEDFTRLVARVQQVGSDADQALFSIVKEPLQLFDGGAGGQGQAEALDDDDDSWELM